MRFINYTIQHIPGKLLFTAEVLSRPPLRETAEELSFNAKETEQSVQSITASLPASAKRLKFYVKEQAFDKICEATLVTPVLF